MKTPHLLLLACAATVLGADAAEPISNPPVVALCFVAAADAFTAVQQKLGTNAAEAVSGVDEKRNTVALNATHAQAAIVRAFLTGLDHQPPEVRVDATSGYHLVQSQIADEVPMHGPVDSATVYVLVCPDERLYVFRAFHSKPMEEIIKHFPRGSVLHYDGNALAARPPQARMEALMAVCKSKGISFITSPTN